MRHAKSALKALPTPGDGVQFREGNPRTASRGTRFGRTVETTHAEKPKDASRPPLGGSRATRDPGLKPRGAKIKKTRRDSRKRAQRTQRKPNRRWTQIYADFALSFGDDSDGNRLAQCFSLPRSKALVRVRVHPRPLFAFLALR
jgi:hypothetical protein